MSNYNEQIKHLNSWFSSGKLRYNSLTKEKLMAALTAQQRQKRIKIKANLALAISIINSLTLGLIFFGIIL